MLRKICNFKAYFGEVDKYQGFLFFTNTLLQSVVISLTFSFLLQLRCICKTWAMLFKDRKHDRATCKR